MPGESSSENENPYGRMYVTEPVRATIPVQNGARLSWDPWMGHLRIRHLARTNRNALGGKGFGGNIFVAHGGKIFAISVFSLTSSFPVFFFSEPWKTRRPLQLSLTPTLTLYTWISFHFFGGRHRSPLGLYHSLHNHLRHPDDRRPGKKGRRVDADLALGFSPV